MRTATHVIQFILAAVLVAAIGGLAGWYFFVHKQIATTEATDLARGANLAPSFGGSLGSAYQNAFTGSSGTPAGSATTTTASPSTAAPRLWHVSSSPVAGMGFAASTSALYFVERASGNVFGADPSTSLVTRLTNTLLPKIYEAVFASDGPVIMRSITDNDVVTTYAASSTARMPGAASTTAPLSGTYLAQGISSIAVRDKPRGLFYLVSDPLGGVVGVTANWNGSAQKKIFSSSLSDWRATLLPDGRIILLEDPADGVMGYAYTLGSTGALAPIVRGLPGLTVLPRTGSTALIYGTSSGGVLSLYATPSAGASTVRLPIGTTADKCVWLPGKNLVAFCAVPQTAPRGDFLDDWYQGRTHTSDAWWQVDVSAGTAAQIFAPDGSLSLDVENPIIDKSGAYITFMNATDKSLWMLKVNQ